MAYSQKDIKDAINVFEKPSEHIQHFTFKDGRESLAYSAPMVKAFEIAIAVLKEKQNEVK